MPEVIKAKAGLGLWDQMVAEDADRFGQEILDPDARKRWCQAILFGGLPHLWCHVARVPRAAAIEKLELVPGDRVLIIGEAISDIGFDAEVAEIVGDEGEVATVDIRSRVYAEAYAGREPKWEWDFIHDYADEHFDCIFVAQGMAHAGDWAREGRELLRVMRPRRRMVVAEISFSRNFYGRVRTDVHLEYWVSKLLEGIGEVVDELPYWELSSVADSLNGQLEAIEMFEWRGVELLWGRKPAQPDRR